MDPIESELSTEEICDATIVDDEEILTQEEISTSEDETPSDKEFVDGEYNIHSDGGEYIDQANASDSDEDSTDYDVNEYAL